ncbi:DUF84 family protein [Cytobacillus sp. Hz8]|uniref:DUF84 family protein n=1 Tax=Cytobacillus sp. Hz8 TaxID=3347168 RepID=UPI0035DB7CA4
MKVVIGTKNPAKVKAVEEAFSHYPCTLNSIDVSSGVSPQPFSDEETIQGALNRAEGALNLGQGDIGIGLEGGVHKTEHGLFLCNWGALAVKGRSPIIAGGARILLPEEIAGELYKGNELGPVMEGYVNIKNVRKKEGAIGIFTNGVVSRAEMFLHVMNLLVGQYEYQR